MMSRDNSVDIVTMLRAERTRNGVRFLAGARDFLSSPQRRDHLRGPPSLLSGVSFLDGKTAGS
jgi:hypothetical protein